MLISGHVVNNPYTNIYNQAKAYSELRDLKVEFLQLSSMERNEM